MLACDKITQLIAFGFTKTVLASLCSISKSQFSEFLRDESAVTEAKRWRIYRTLAEIEAFTEFIAAAEEVVQPLRLDLRDPARVRSAMKLVLEKQAGQ